jgi:uncharacterized repeat protein (TIGR01451 family)
MELSSHSSVPSKWQSYLIMIPKQVVPDSVHADEQLTYTLFVTNTGNVALTATVTDLLPAHVTPTGVRTWMMTIPAPGGVWTQTVVVTSGPSYAGPLINVVQVTTLEGATGIYTHALAPDFDIAKYAIPEPVQAGKRLTYTVALTNTGNFDLHATVTDTPSVHVTPIGTLTWTPTIPAPDGVWTQTVVVTVEMDYEGVVTNVIQVTSAEGPRGAYTRTTTVEKAVAGLQVVNDSPTTLSQATRLTATITAGSNAVYTWNFGDDSMLLITGETINDGAAVTHVYPDAGIYTAVVTASNGVSVITTTTVITITDTPIVGLVATNDSPTILGDATTLTATIVSGSNVTYAWALGDGSTVTGAIVTHTYPAVNIYTAIVTASNGTSVVTATTTITIYCTCCVRLNDGLTGYPTIQAAVDASTHPTDVVKVAGYCSDVHVRSRNDVTTTGVVTQVVYISKTLTLQGGWNISFTQQNVINYPTTLDAQGQGRILYITGDISPTIEGLQITGGNANELRGGPWGWEDVGGGVYIITATATIKDNQIFNNTASYWRHGYGGGLYLVSSDAILSGNTIISNTAESGSGGGVYLRESPAVLIGNTVISNTSYAGGGVYLRESLAVLSGNIVISNTAAEGGGLFLLHSPATLSGNVVYSNTALFGGGLFLESSDATLTGNTVFANTARGAGGGLLVYSDNVMLSGNTILSNTADRGGGLFLVKSNVKLTNNVIADNWANSAGGGLYIEDSSSWLSHNTISRNSSGDGSGVYVTDWSDLYSVAILTNTILVSHSVGISVTGGNTVVVNGILWHNTPITISQAVTAIVTAQNQHAGAPAFVDPDAGNYHIGVASAAVDVGVDAGVSDDMDGEPRPMGRSPDLGADELGIAMIVSKQATPDPVQSGTPLTYTIQITNNGLVTLTAAVTDTLLPGETSSGTLLLSNNVLTWTNVTITPGNVWMTQFTITIGAGYAGILTNVVQVATDESARATVTETAFANIAPAADAGPDLYVVESDAVLLDGSSSTDPDGHTPLIYRWRHISGPFVILVDADKAQAAFQAPPYQSILTFTLTVTDALGLSSKPDTVIVYVGIEPPSNQPPYTPSNPTPRNEMTGVPLTQTLSWQGDDPDGDPVTYTVALGDVNPPPVVATDVTTTTYAPDLLASLTTYYWVITASDGVSATGGPTWRFTTESEEMKVYLPMILKDY